MLNRNTYNLARVADGQTGNQLLPQRAFKGISNIVFNFLFPPASNEVIKLRITRNGSVVSTFQRSKIPSKYEVIVTPSPTQYLSSENFQIILTYDNFRSYSFFAPILIAQTSYYKDLDGLHVKNAQFIDSKSNGDMLLVMQTDAKDVYNVTLHANEQQITTTSASLSSETNVLAAVSSPVSSLTAIETDVEQNIEVLT